MVKKLKTKQRQKQRQKQSVVVNVNLGKHSASGRSKINPRSQSQQLPTPIYASPIQNLVPQVFSGGKQVSQPTLEEQMKSIMKSLSQPQTPRMLGPSSMETNTPIRRVRTPLRTSSSLEEFTISQEELMDSPGPKLKKKGGRPIGAKNKPKIYATEFLEGEVVDAIPLKSNDPDPEYSEKLIPPPFDKEERTSLQSAEPYYETPPNIITNPPVEEGFKEIISKKTKKGSKKKNKILQ